MLKIKDYIILRDIEQYLEKVRKEELESNKGFSTIASNELEKLLKDLRKIINKLENED